MDKINELQGSLKNKILTSGPDLIEYGKDWTKFYSPNPLAILFPVSTQEVQSIVLWARKHKVSLVPSGGRTGLSGAAVAQNAEVVVSLSKMNKILSLDPTDRVLLCEAGCLTEEIQDYAREHNLLFPVDFAARGSSQIGGNVSTNVGGLNVVRYGLMRDWVAGLEVVTGQGEILNLNKSLVKNATGYDLRHLFIGSEGTLGIITQVSLKLTTPAKKSTALVLGTDDAHKITTIFNKFRQAVTLNAFEFFSEQALNYVLKSHTTLTHPFQNKSPFYILLDIESTQEDSALSIFESCLEEGLISDGVISQNEKQAQNFWKYRDYISESISSYTPYKNDISIRISKIPSFLKEADLVLKASYPHFEIIWFGHIGDGNLHINILKPQDISASDFLKICQNVDQSLFEVVRKFEGSVSAEHGVGLTKKPFLNYTRSEEEIQIMRAIKKVLDPDLILNPGKIFDS